MEKKGVFLRARGLDANMVRSSPEGSAVEATVLLLDPPGYLLLLTIRTRTRTANLGVLHTSPLTYYRGGRLRVGRLCFRTKYLCTKWAWARERRPGDRCRSPVAHRLTGLSSLSLSLSLSASTPSGHLIFTSLLPGSSMFRTEKQPRTNSHMSGWFLGP